MRKYVTLAMLLALAVIMGYLEALLPLPVGIPGIKLGLANYVTVMVLYLFGFRETMLIGVLRACITGFMFSNLTMILYSLSGIVCSVIGMYLLKRFKCFSYIGVSAAGGVLHNMAQIVTAVIMLQTKEIVGYLPFLMVGGLTAGVIIGILCKMTYPVVHKSYYLLK